MSASESESTASQPSRGRDGRHGVLLVNLGSPDAPEPDALRRYLREFLSDPRVVDWPRWIWRPVLEGIILRTRPRKSAALYARVWTDDGSPLIVTTRAQAAALSERLGDALPVAVAMRYGEPSLEQGLAELRDQGCEHVLVVPLFPQYADATTGSVLARVSELLAGRDDAPRWSALPAFPDHPGYIAALAQRAREAAAEFGPDHHVFSFHGVPERYVTRKGDPYAEHCQRTADALADALGLGPSDWTLAWQSRFGPERWLRPATDDVARELAPRAPRVLVSCPGFVAGCLETLDEIGRELAVTFREAGGEALQLVPAVDDSAPFVEALAELVRAQLAS